MPRISKARAIGWKNGIAQHKTSLTLWDDVWLMLEVGLITRTCSPIHLITLATPLNPLYTVRQLTSVVGRPYFI
jgi:hypothetical protein